ncbi:MAG: hypothetical protein IT381_22845 [Deltaproteobacteria bacterium]|nr:hypothetical protein [Deltaproteobacteria bacterium]
MSEEQPFQNLPDVTPEDIEDFNASLKDSLEQFQKTGDLTFLVGLKPLGTPPEAVQAAVALGGQLVRQGFLDKAFQYFAGLVELDPLNYEIYRWLAHIQHLQKNYIGAYENYMRAMTLNPVDPVTQIALGECMLMIDDVPTNGMFRIEEGIALAGKDPKYAVYVTRGEQLIVAAKERVDEMAKAAAAPAEKEKK